MVFDAYFDANLLIFLIWKKMHFLERFDFEVGKVDESGSLKGNLLGKLPWNFP